MAAVGGMEVMFGIGIGGNSTLGCLISEKALIGRGVRKDSRSRVDLVLAWYQRR